MTAGTGARDEARQKVRDWLTGSTATHVLGAVTRMNLADAIGDGEADVDDLAKKYDIPVDRFSRFLGALLELGVCEQRASGGVALTELGSLLRPGQPDSLHDLVVLMSDEITQRSFAGLETCVRTGRASFEEAFGTSIFAYLAQKPELSTVYNAAMGALSAEVAEAVAEHYDFGPFATVTDVGGGNGTLLNAILRRNPHLDGILFDSAEGAAQSAETMRAAGLAERCAVVTGDFFRSIPDGADLYLLKSILHDWTDERATAILRRCREAMSARSRLLVIEKVLPDTTGRGVARDAGLADLTMMVIYSGRERRRAEFEWLCARAGLSVTNVVPLHRDGFAVIEAVPTGPAEAV
ncbi:O-methyltransferase [Streptoalloteichus hindustanus]|uniref:O-methyltransferase n=2 Tax=Streptoalloteichus hindustanus TaxID=2017 RepID=A0A1M5EZ56_STRHI|nr:O-methyltransferase [Streptoalloteichus hindustanus]